MLPSASQSVSKNPATVAIATYLFSIGNRAFSEPGYVPTSARAGMFTKGHLPAVDLRVHRTLDPERAILVEFGDALARRTNLGLPCVVVARSRAEVDVDNRLGLANTTPFGRPH
jgi:hypothetical protein